MDLQPVAFARGFAMSRGPWPGVPAWYVGCRLPDGWSLWHDPSVSCQQSVSASGTQWVALLGTAIDVIDGEAGVDRVAPRLLVALTRDQDRLFEAVDRLSGRFVLIYGTGTTVRLLHDATGMRSVFYYLGEETLVASHANLLQRAIGAPESRVRQLQTRPIRPLDYTFGLPGCETPYQGVRCLTPNTLLDLTARRVVRHFPREPLRPLAAAEARDIVLPMMDRQAAWLASGRAGRLLVSLTAGMDSRVTLAVLKPYLDCAEFFTYRRPDRPLENRDAVVAGEIAARLGLRHQVLDTAEIAGCADEFAQFENALRSSCFYHHNRAVAYLFARTFAGRPSIHLRSNVYEIARGGYDFSPPIKWLADWMRLAPKKASIWLQRRLGWFSARDMVRLYRHGMLGEPAVVAAFKDFFELTRFDQRCGYDAYDLFYWEHRMGMWHSQVVLESDPSFESHSLLNARVILLPMMAVPLADRRAGTVFSSIVECALPELSGLPINPPAWPAALADVQSRLASDRQTATTV